MDRRHNPTIIMTDTTTIEITEEQRDELKALKAHDRESYKSVIDRVLSTSDMGRVYEPTLERFNGHKADARADDMPELSADSFLNTLLDTYERVQEQGGYPDGGSSDLPDDLRDQLDRIESAASTAEERTGSIENTLEGLSR